ncbi:MAG TPA: DUF4258 domain-containing protein [Ferruginibacter sp.]|nr:DUF4258 domain-containing protein [Ferruginibacter sp.]
MGKQKYTYLLAILVLAVLFWINRGQRGDAGSKAPAGAGSGGYESMIDRQGARLIFSKHARCRMGCRQIDEQEVREIIASGRINADKVEDSRKGISIPLEGVTRDGQRVRIVVAPKKNKEMVLVTVIDLDTEWACACP